MKRQIVKLLAVIAVVLATSVGANAQFRYAAIVDGEHTNLKFKQFQAYI